MTPDELLALYSEAFKSIVNSDIRGECDDETAAALRSPQVARRWYNMLVSTKRSIETQLATFKIERTQKMGSKDYNKWLEDKLKWKAGALRFKSSVEGQIAEAKEYLRLGTTTEADILRQAIIDHKVNCIESPDDVEDHDEVLWGVVA